MGSVDRRAGKPGPEPLFEQRAEFARLMSLGLSNSEACRRVRVNRRTGTRWRYGRTVTLNSGAVLEYPPMAAPATKKSISPRYLSEDERVLIGDGLRTGMTMTQIGEDLGRSTSTISREVDRNSDDAGRYRPFAAHRMALQRLARPKERRLTQDTVLRATVQNWLDLRWSPEQIAHTLRIEHPTKTAWHVVHESIYQAIYDKDSPLGRGKLPCLRTKRRRRRPHRVPGSRRGSGPREMTMIDQRPAEADDRIQAGHWEGDLITGASNRSAIGTLVERTTRFTLLVHLPDNHTADATRAGVAAAMGGLPSGLRRTLTWDQGSEMAGHLQLTAEMGMSVYFCQAHSPWQRPTNENSNGLLRDYFPKGTDLGVHSAERLLDVQNELNNRPRKCLNWESPATVLGRLQLTHS